MMKKLLMLILLTSLQSLAQNPMDANYSIYGRPSGSGEVVAPRGQSRNQSPSGYAQTLESPQTKTRYRGHCSLRAVAAYARQIGGRTTTSSHKCLPRARDAFIRAGCSIPPGFHHNARYAWAHLQGVWNCSSGGPRSAPDGAAIFYVGCGSTHVEVKSGGCFYSDFHHPDCLPASEYHSCKYQPLGWCTP